MITPGAKPNVNGESAAIRTITGTNCVNQKGPSEHPLKIDVIGLSVWEISIGISARTWPLSLFGPTAVNARGIGTAPDQVRLDEIVCARPPGGG